MTAPTWKQLPNKEWLIEVVGVGTYVVRKNSYTRDWRAYFNERPTVFHGRNAQQAKEQVDRVIRAFNIHSKRGRKR